MSHTVRWTAEKVTQRLALIEPRQRRLQCPLSPFRYLPLSSPADEPPVAAQVETGDWSLVEPDTYWAGADQNFVLRTHFQAPPDWDPSLPVGLYLPIGDSANFSHPETLAYLDGVAYAGVDRHHRLILLDRAWLDGSQHSLALHGWTGPGADWRGESPMRLVMGRCALVQIDVPTRDFVILARVALGAALGLDENAPERGALLNALDRAFALLDTRDPLEEAFYASIPTAHAALQEGIAAAGAPMNVGLTASGHAHIDVAWLWTLDQTRRKAGRTFYTVLRLMERFPEYHFTQSQPQLYEFVRHDYPELFAAIRERVAEGRWEPTGGMWVEADCNLSGAEALARQFLLGRAYFRRHFGEAAESPILWLPDVFGYAWALPQLVKQAGLEYFFTIKLSWNQYNRLPYDSFWWQGLDGTRLLTHFSTTSDTDTSRSTTYNAQARPGDVLRSWRRFQQKELQNELFMAFGYGDGGGGPTAEMIENIEVMAEFPGLPRVRQRPAIEFFRDLERESGERLPVWNGELYLEYHRGTYTSQARNKRRNRKAEFGLHDAEFLASYAACLDAEYTYPAEDLRSAWELVCLNQFHDIIPGSSIAPVYVDSQAQYARIESLLAGVNDGALKTIARRLGGDLLLANPTAFARHDLAWWEGHLPEGCSLRLPGGTPATIQRTKRGVWIDAGEIPPYSVMALRIDEVDPCTENSALHAEAQSLENEFLRLEFNPQGDLIRIYDKRFQRELLPPGEIGNVFQAFEDRPMFWDAWDIDIFYEDRVWGAEPATSMRVVERGPLRAALEIQRKISSSVCTQRIALQRGSARIDFETSIDWRERHTLLKVAFPLEVLAPQATYEIQWGNVQRPTHRNTSWDWARFETCAHKWADLSEGDYGVSLLNDCKYGYDIHDNVMRLSLLRGPTMPDPDADLGEQRFTYSLLPHAGDWRTETPAQAYALNDALIVHRDSQPFRHRAARPLVQCEAANVIVETIKRAEDGDGYVVRLYESQRRRGAASFQTGFKIRRLERANLLEEFQEALDHEGDRFSLSLRPYEIVTLRLVPE